RENLSAFARACAGVGSAVITVVTMKAVYALGGGNELIGFRWFAGIVAVLFAAFIAVTCINIKEKSTADIDSPSVKQMFKALLGNDQAMAVVITIVLVNCSIYLTSNLVIYFFKYDFGGTKWYDGYTLFNTFGGAMQILAMIAFFPLLRRFFDTRRVFYVSLFLGMAGYAVLLVLAFVNMSSVFLLFIPAFCIFSANGLVSVLTTIFLANTVEYGELVNSRRDESVIFSMQTFVVKLASGVAVLLASVGLSVFRLSGDAVTEADKLRDFSEGVSAASKTGLRMTMTVLPVIGLTAAVIWFARRYKLTDGRMKEINSLLAARRGEGEK
ncbi:MAG: MFS transporter, partial [Oscillospiraceae bacterium]|nr:MFS transporter [Oscillospiraceae bacterium]